MCGIIAVKGKNTIKSVLKGLKALEYRGYDSCGVACKNSNGITTVKRVGYVDKLYESGVQNIDSELAIGHTRWATHGGVLEKNSHPHSSSSGDFVIVHNGILENYLELKNKYLKGITFASDTDSEVIAQLIEYFYKGNVWEAFRNTIKELSGSYAVVMINVYDNNVYFAKSSSPMVIGRNNSEFAIASDINGLGNVSDIVYIKDGNIGYIDNEIHIYNVKDNEKVDIEFISSEKGLDQVNKGDFPHYMLKEIYEIPSALKQCYKSITSAEFNLPRKIDRVLMVSCGTSYHSSLMGKKYLESIVGIPVTCEIASEYIYNKNVTMPNTLGIFISQSGETADTLTAIKRAKSEGVYTLALTNVENSSITQLVDEVLYLKAGAEICVASTKAYTSQVFALLLLANILKNHRDNNYEVDNLVKVCPSRTYNYLEITEQEFVDIYKLDIGLIEKEVDLVISDLKDRKEIFLIGKDYDYVSSMEGALKIKEVSYIFTDAYPCGELKHGTLALIDNSSMVISIMTDDRLLSKVENSVHEIVSRGGSVMAITQMDIGNGDFKHIIKLPEVNRILIPIISIIPIDLIAYKISVSKGINPDKPRNLAKSVTVE